MALPARYASQTAAAFRSASELAAFPLSRKMTSEMSSVAAPRLSSCMVNSSAKTGSSKVEAGCKNPYESGEACAWIQCQFRGSSKR